MKLRGLTLDFPALGLNRRLSLQRQPPYFSSDCLNCRVDTTSNERERGGTRPGLSKSHTTAGGDEWRGLGTVQYLTSGNVATTKLYGIADGSIWLENTATTLSEVSSALTLATDRFLQTADRSGVVYIADYGAKVCSGSDGVISGTSFTSASVGNFASAGVDKDDMVLVITGHSAVNEVQAITFTGTATAGTWRVRYDGQTTDPLAYNISTADLQVALRALTSIDGPNVTVTGTAGSSYVCTFSAELSGADLPLMTVDDDQITGATITVAETTKGYSATDRNGSWQLSNVVTTTLTTSKTIGDATGVIFYVARAPKKYNPTTGVLSLWLTEDNLDGTPKGFTPNSCPLLCLWRDRLCLAGGTATPHLWYLSAAGNPLDFDYGADPEDPSRAIAGQNSDAGQIGEPITALIPHDNNCLIFGCTTSLWVCRGDPGYGGQIDRLSSEVGVLSAQSWCYTPEGYLFFLSQDGLYMMGPGCGSTPVSVSRERMPQELRNIDTSAYTVSMAYDVFDRGIHIFISKNSAATAEHWWVDVKLSMYGDTTNASFWPVQLGSTDYDPFCCHARRNHSDSKSWVILGCRDGYLRRFDNTVSTDDGTAYSSYVDYGPFRVASSDFADGMIHDFTGLVGEGSDDVAWAIRFGETLEGAYSASALTRNSGTWTTTGLQYPRNLRQRCQAAVVRISNGETGGSFEMEGLRLTLSDLGKQRKR